jgi:hypothetical protein
LTSIEYFEQRLAESLLRTCRPLTCSNISTCARFQLPRHNAVLAFVAWQLKLDWRIYQISFQAVGKYTACHDDLLF